LDIWLSLVVLSVHSDLYFNKYLGWIIFEEPVLIQAGILTEDSRLDAKALILFHDLFDFDELLVNDLIELLDFILEAEPLLVKLGDTLMDPPRFNSGGIQQLLLQLFNLFLEEALVILVIFVELSSVLILLVLNLLDLLMQVILLFEQ
jgi:hypothetical protein